MYQLRNLINRRNVLTKPEKDVNANEDFLTSIVTSHFLAACMHKLGMKSLDDVPTASGFEFNESTWMLPDSDRKSILYSFCQTVISESVNFSMNGDINCSRDGVVNYAKELKSLGIFYLSYKDAVHEGNGDRVLVCWKYILPLFKVSDRRNYSLEVVRMLYSYYFTMSPRQKHQLLWSRFVNVHGKVGHNIANDLHMEHLNRVVKNAVHGFGAKKIDEFLKRIGRVVGPLGQSNVKLRQECSEEYKSKRRTPQTCFSKKGPRKGHQ